MSLDLHAGPAAEQRQLHHPRVVDVGRNVHQAVAQPPRANGGRKAVAILHSERDNQHERHQKLPERAAQRMPHRRRPQQEDMAGLVKYQVNAVRERRIISKSIMRAVKKERL